MTEAMRGAILEVLRHGYVPFMLLGICGGAVVLIGRGGDVATALGLVARLRAALETVHRSGSLTTTRRMFGIVPSAMPG
jgi:hypothetical protein